LQAMVSRPAHASQFIAPARRCARSKDNVGLSTHSSKEVVMSGQVWTSVKGLETPSERARISLTLRRAGT
jgi:hypothetical protein